MRVFCCCSFFSFCLTPIWWKIFLSQRLKSPSGWKWNAMSRTSIFDRMNFRIYADLSDSIRWLSISVWFAPLSFRILCLVVIYLLFSWSISFLISTKSQWYLLPDFGFCFTLLHSLSFSLSNLFLFIYSYYTKIDAIESVLQVCVHWIDAKISDFIYSQLKADVFFSLKVIKWRFHIYKKSHLRIRNQTDRNEPCSVSNCRSWTTTCHYFGTTTHFIGYKLFVLIDFTKNSPTECQMISGASPITSNVRYSSLFSHQIETWEITREFGLFYIFSKDYWFFVFFFLATLAVKNDDKLN